MTVDKNDNVWLPLPREEVIKAVARKKPSRIPLVFAKWWGEGLTDQYGDRLQEFDRYPDDAARLFVSPVNIGAMKLSWKVKGGKAHDSKCVIDDWAQLDEFIEKLPDPENDPQFEAAIPQAEQIRAQDRYFLFGWWNLFFERPWQLRGMGTLMVDYYESPDKIHRLHSALCDQYCRYLKVGIRELRPDGFWSSDDLGHQTQLMMSPTTFRELLKPYYERVGKVTKDAGIHFWLHSCGDNTPILGDLAEVGVNVFHPVQKGTMNEIAVAREYGDKMSFLVGFDVQHILQEEDPDGVRAEARYLIDTFDRSNGGMCFAAGNGIVAGTPFENIEAFLDEAVRYGTEHRRRFVGR